MAWSKIETVTLGADGKTLQLTTFTAKKFINIMAHMPIGTLVAGRHARLEFNSDTGTNYANRQSTNGGADATTTSQTYNKFDTACGDNDGFMVGYIINISAEEKLSIGFVINANAAGASNTPNRAECVGKWANTSAEITDSEINSSQDDMDTDSNYSMLGTD